MRKTGYEAHHIVQARFSKVLRVNPRGMPAIALTQEEHAFFDAIWRERIKYGGKYAHVEIATAVHDVYRDYPELRKIALEYLK